MKIKNTQPETRINVILHTALKDSSIKAAREYGLSLSTLIRLLLTMFVNGEISLGQKGNKK